MGIRRIVGCWAALRLVLVGIAISTASTAFAQETAPAGWRLAWSDDFDVLDETKWRRADDDKPTNNSLHAYLPEQVSVADGKLVILSENKPAHGQPHRSGLVTSQRAQRCGRWEVRAQLPTTAGIWPAIWLLPDGPWPSEGEIDFMEYRGDRPALVTSAFHWGAAEPYQHDYHVVEHQAAIADQLVTYDREFHTFAVEWLPDQLRFFVDDLHHATFYSDECGDFFPKLTAPMRLVINTAVGGDYCTPPDATTVWPQRLLVDWVRVYERDADKSEEPQAAALRNGDFEERGGSLAGWHVFGSRTDGQPNVQAYRGAVHSGRASLKVSGPGGGDENYSGVSQGVPVQGGDRVRAQLSAKVLSAESLANTDNRVTMKIEFYKNRGDYFGGPAMLATEERPVADAATVCDAWRECTVAATAPPGTVEARLSIVLAQKNQGSGAVHIDDVTLKAE